MIYFECIQLCFYRQTIKSEINNKINIVLFYWIGQLRYIKFIDFKSQYQTISTVDFWWITIIY